MANYPSLPIAWPYGIKPPAYGTIRTEMEQGYVQTRAKVTKALRRWVFQHQMLTASEKATWLSCWNTYKGGSNTFTFHDPESNADVTVRFAMTDPDIVWICPGRYNISVELEEAL